jgi:hypothetical protein
LTGCANSTPVSIPKKNELKNNGLVIGSLSRNNGKVFFEESSISIFDTNKSFIKNIFNRGEDISYKSIRNPFYFEDDLKYNNRKGSIFSFLLPQGEYIITKYYTGYSRYSGNKRYLDNKLGYIGEYQKKITVKNGTTTYIGDYKFEPSSTRNDSWLKNDIPLGAKCTISNRLDRDFPIFQKYFNNKLNQNDIIINTDESEFILQNSQFNPRTTYYKQAKQAKKKTHPALIFLLVEGLVAINAWMASEEPNLFGRVLMLLAPMGMTGVKIAYNYKF